MNNDCSQIKISLVSREIFITIFEKSTTMGIPELKAGLIKKILETNDTDILNDVYRLLDTGKSDFYENLTADQRAEIELGLKQIRNGETISLEDFLKKVS